MPSLDHSVIEVVCELAHDGVWTLPQLEARRRSRDYPEIPTRYLSVSKGLLRPTGWSRAAVPVDIVRPTLAAAEIARARGVDAACVREDQIEHAVGLAELRWTCGVRVCHSISGERLLNAQIYRRTSRDSNGFHGGPDGAYVLEQGLVLCEYDSGRYSARQVREKVIAAQSIRCLEGRKVVGHLWGVPTPMRGQWLRSHGASSITVIPSSSWLGRDPSFEIA